MVEYDLGVEGVEQSEMTELFKRQIQGFGEVGISKQMNLLRERFFQYDYWRRVGYYAEHLMASRDDVKRVIRSDPRLIREFVDGQTYNMDEFLKTHPKWFWEIVDNHCESVRRGITANFPDAFTATPRPVGFEVGVEVRVEPPEKKKKKKKGEDGNSTDDGERVVWIKEMEALVKRRFLLYKKVREGVWAVIALEEIPELGIATNDIVSDYLLSEKWMRVYDDTAVPTYNDPLGVYYQYFVTIGRLFEQYSDNEVTRAYTIEFPDEARGEYFVNGFLVYLMSLDDVRTDLAIVQEVRTLKGLGPDVGEWKYIRSDGGDRNSNSQFTRALLRNYLLSAQTTPLVTEGLPMFIQGRCRIVLKLGIADSEYEFRAVVTFERVPDGRSWIEYVLADEIELDVVVRWEGTSQNRNFFLQEASTHFARHTSALVRQNNSSWFTQFSMDPGKISWRVRLGPDRRKAKFVRNVLAGLTGGLAVRGDIGDGAAESVARRTVVHSSDVGRLVDQIFSEHYRVVIDGSKRALKLLPSVGEEVAKYLIGNLDSYEVSSWITPATPGLGAVLRVNEVTHPSYPGMVVLSVPFYHPRGPFGDMLDYAEEPVKNELYSSPVYSIPEGQKVAEALVTAWVNSDENMRAPGASQCTPVVSGVFLNETRLARVDGLEVESSGGIVPGNRVYFVSDGRLVTSSGKKSADYVVWVLVGQPFWHKWKKVN